LDAYEYLVLDATYEKVRMEQKVVSAALLIAYGVDKAGHRRVLGASTEVSEAEVHWRSFLNDLVKRGLHGLKMITSDAHEGLKAAREAIFPTVPWQRCQFHLQQNAGKYVTRKDKRKEVAEDLRTIFKAGKLEYAKRYLRLAIEKYSKQNPTLSSWIEENIPEGMTVSQMPKKHWVRLRTSNMAERQMKEIKRRTKVAGIFPNAKSLNRLACALLMEKDEAWLIGKRYLDMEIED
jgi:putative transposase